MHVIDDYIQDVAIAAEREPPRGRKQYMTCSKATSTTKAGQLAKINVVVLYEALCILISF
ncbi:hypothetical protein NC653_008237 [Populus alba x Populus x berolinensis]|uniref:Uncharacterized protein n=1 Tax=Populus alba x Populus x berolinensis TaxID=444605 RepID=A0AAD6W9R3_9ROSI|nr:hypothetical protein NC653_008237 [Populus alba x Populus x berolinensis]